MIPGVNIISGKASVASVNGARRLEGASSLSSEVFRIFLGSKEHLDWLNIDLNAVEIITAQDYERTKN